MKYGKNMWARVSSLLIRKSAKQCKARWYEWLDPSIKKTEWSREEDEKLLHLAKIMPTQWKTIAQIIGRTSAQCLERFEKLLDQASGKTEDDPSDPRRLRAGDIDPFPETKPARPDPKDMDEDEKEMLSEARARLANTKGKKAKRKAREKQLEAARRTAALQKRRELKAAGIITGEKKKKKKRKHGMDYNEEVPFEVQVPKGFYDVSDDLKRTREIKKDPKFMNIDIKRLDGERRDVVEARERKKDLKRQKLRQESNLPDYIDKVNELNDPRQLRRRPQMVLPAPQVTDQELSEIAKLGDMAPPTSSGLSTNLASRGGMTPLRGARTPLAQSSLMQEAQNIINLQKATTPLQGGSSTPMVDSDFSGLTPRPSTASTPNVLASPLTMNQTPLVGSTPVRDTLSINNPRANAAQQNFVRAQLRRGLKALSAPKYDYALVLPDLPPEPKMNEEEVEEDMEDVLSLAEARAQAKREKELRERSSVLQRDLPRPVSVNPLTPSKNASEAERLILAEMSSLLYHDAAKYPVSSKTKAKNVAFERFDEDLLAIGSRLIEEEANKESEVDMKEYLEAATLIYQDNVYLPSKKSFGSLSSVSKKEKLQAFEQQFAVLSKDLNAYEKKEKKASNRVSILLKGLTTRSSVLSSDVNSSYHALVQDGDQLTCFDMLRANENAAIPVRIKELQREVDEVVRSEGDLQRRYRELVAEKERLLASKAK